MSRSAANPSSPPALSAVRQPEQADTEGLSLRPQGLADFVGQRKLKGNLQVFIAAARARGDALDHLLFHGPPGLGKTTLSAIVARELGVGLRTTSGPIINRAGDLAAILTALQPRDVLFIDEIHRLPAAVEEVLYPAMEDRKLDILIGEGPTARTVRLDLPPFTLIGATTRSGLLTTPLRDRFSIPLRLEFYEQEELQIIVGRAASLLKLELSPDGAAEIAKRSRGTPRIAERLVKRVRDFAEVARAPLVDATMADQVLTALEVDRHGLDGLDRRYLHGIAHHYRGGPVGIDTMAALLAEQRDTLEDVVEPYLLQLGLLQRTARGRQLTNQAFEVLGLPPPSHLATIPPTNETLFD